MALLWRSQEPCGEATHKDSSQQLFKPPQPRCQTCVWARCQMTPAPGMESILAFESLQPKLQACGLEANHSTASCPNSWPTESMSTWNCVKSPHLEGKQQQMRVIPLRLQELRSDEKHSPNVLIRELAPFFPITLPLWLLHQPRCTYPTFTNLPYP